MYGIHPLGSMYELCHYFCMKYNLFWLYIMFLVLKLFQLIAAPCFVTFCFILAELASREELFFSLVNLNIYFWNDLGTNLYT